jgi:hypothetical protein
MQPDPKEAVRSLVEAVLSERHWSDTIDPEARRGLHKAAAAIHSGRISHQGAVDSFRHTNLEPDQVGKFLQRRVSYLKAGARGGREDDEE